MRTLQCDYTELINWIETNPKVRTFTNFATEMGFSVQRIHYHIAHNTFMPKIVINKAKKTYHFTDEEIDKFFYTPKLAK